LHFFFRRACERESGSERGGAEKSKSKRAGFFRLPRLDEKQAMKMTSSSRHSSREESLRATINAASATPTPSSLTVTRERAEARERGGLNARGGGGNSSRLRRRRQRRRRQKVSPPLPAPRPIRSLESTPLARR
jgi:hypothetical protein